MDEIRINSDDWTGRDPARAAPTGMSQLWQSRWRKFGFALGCIALVMFGMQLYPFLIEPSWSSAIRLAGPMVNVLLGFSLYFNAWNRPRT